MVTLEYRNITENKSKDFITKLYNKLVLLDENREFDITLINNPMKKYNQYFFKIIIK